MPDRTISIKVNVWGNLIYKGVNAAGNSGEKENAAIAKVYPEDTVVWECNKDYYIIDFGSDSPFDRLRYIGTKNKPISATVKGQTTKEESQEESLFIHKYSVTVFNSKGVKKYSDDPVLIVPR